MRSGSQTEAALRGDTLMTSTSMPRLETAERPEKTSSDATASPVSHTRVRDGGEVSEDLT